MVKLERFLGKTLTLRIGGNDTARGVLCHTHCCFNKVRTEYFLQAEKRDYRITNKGKFDRVRIAGRDSDVLLMDRGAFTDTEYLPPWRLSVA
jgi:hypothetical protein